MPPTKSGQKLLIIGLDGATFDLALPMIEKGEMPNLGQLLAQGTAANLLSTVPPVTGPAWSSFMTGKDPGGHGVYHFRAIDPTQYDQANETLVTSRSFQGPTFWDILGEVGHRVAVVTVPVTYPPWPINGVMISGYPCPDTRNNHTYPPEFADQLPDPLNFDATFYSTATPEAVAEEGLRMMARRTQVTLDLINSQTFDVIITVLGEIDRAQHNFWKMIDPKHPSYSQWRDQPLANTIHEHYRQADQAIGHMIDAAGEGAIVVIMSDHGAGLRPLDEFHINAFLQQQGLLALKSGSVNAINAAAKLAVQKLKELLPPVLKAPLAKLAPIKNTTAAIEGGTHWIDWDHTLAYRFPLYDFVDGIEINLKGRQAQGIVQEGPEYEELRTRIIATIKEATDPRTGEKIVKEAWRREELYKGSQISRAPDIVVMTDAKYAGGNNPRGPLVTTTPTWRLESLSGRHRMEGILVMAGPHIVQNQWLGSPPSICDIAPTLLYALQRPIPSSMTGRVLTELFEDSYTADHPFTIAEEESATANTSQHPSAEEEEQMKDKLRGLGYL